MNLVDYYKIITVLLVVVAVWQRLTNFSQKEEIERLRNKLIGDGNGH